MSESGLVSVVEILHGKVTCPCGCEKTFSVSRSVHDTKLSFLDDDQRKIVAWCKANLVAEIWETKEGIRQLMINAGGIINPNPFDSAILFLTKLQFFKTKQEGQDMLYQFQKSRFEQYLKEGGYLK